MKSVIYVLGASVLALNLSVRAAIITVYNTDISGPGSFHQAILEANALPGPDVIQFNLPSVPAIISLNPEPPVITETLEIDGRSQPGYAGEPVISLESGFTAVNLVFLDAPNSSVSGLAFRCIGAEFFDAAIRFQHSDGSKVVGCWIG